MTRLYGSLTNRLEEGNQYGKLVVGMGATEMCYSDRHAYEVVEVIDDKHVIVRRCKAIRTDDNGMSDCQTYEYQVEDYKEWVADDIECMMMHLPKGTIRNNNVKLTKTKNGWKQRLENGKFNINKFTLGIKEEYYDYTF